jgi:fatty acid synthase
VLKLFDKCSNFFLVGYSFGSILALKLAKFLESHGKSGNVMMIDGSPNFMHRISTMLISDDNNDDFIKQLIIMTVIKILFRDRAQEVSTKVLSQKNVHDQVETFLDLAQHEREYSVDYGRKMLTGLFNRLKMLRNMNVDSFPVLQKSKLSFVKASVSSLNDFDEDYGLKNYVHNNDIEMNVLDGDHVTVLNNIKLIDLINNAAK